MKQTIVIAFVLLCACGLSAGYSGVDLSQLTSVSSFQCLVSNNYHFAVVRTFQSNGVNDPNGYQSVANAWAGGMSYVDVYMFPCTGCSSSPQEQVQSAANWLRSHNTKFGMFWLDIEGPGTYWGSNQASNQAFFNGLVSEAKAQGLTIGVYTSASQWNPIMGSSFTGGSAYPLWYAHYDGDPSFSDFSPFGGWTKPNIKQYQGTTSLCGAGVDLDWYP